MSQKHFEAWRIAALTGLLLAAGVTVAQPAGDVPPDVSEAMEKAILEADVPPASPAAAPSRRAESFKPGQVARLGASTRSRAVRLTAHSAAMRETYGALKPPAGKTFLVLDLEFENIIPLTLVRDKKVATEYQVPDLSDHLYLLLDGTRVARLRKDGGGLPGHLPVKEFKLRMIGTKARGNAIFEVPAGAELKVVELRYYDYAHGHMRARLAGADEAFAAVEKIKPKNPAQKNEVVELAVFNVEKAAERNGRKAPQGMTFVTADLRARSTFTADGDATAFDPKAKPGAKMKIGHVADWKESRKYLQLVADGEYGYAPEPDLTELEEEPRFLPDVMTGGKVVFLAPAEAGSLELRCDFPNARASTGAGTFRPRGLTLALEGKRPSLPEREAIAEVEDDVYQVSIVDQQVTSEFAGKTASGDNRFLVLDVTVTNTGKNGEFFQTGQQLKHADEKGGQSPLVDATFAGPRRPAPLVWIPPGERRTFQAVFEVPPDETRPRLAFTGVSRADVLNLQPIGGNAVATNNAPEKMPEKAPAKAPARPPAKPPAKEPTKVAANTNPAKPNTPPTRPAQAAKTTPTKPTVKPKPAEKPTRVAAKQPHEPRGLKGVGLTPEQVNAAIDKGAEALWAHRSKELKEYRATFGDELGYDALVALALVHADYHKKNPQFDAALRHFLETVDPPRLGTYGVACLAMTIEGYGDGTYLPQLRKAVRALMENQFLNGTWGYQTNVKEDLLRDPNADRVLQVRGGVPLEGPGAEGEPMTRLTKPDPEATGDNSTSQYALLGLWSAARSTVPVDPQTWEFALDAYRAHQSEDGGWGYHGRSNGYGSMTCAGVCSIAIARHQLGEAAPAEDEAIERGLAWLANNFSVSEHPKGAEAHLYYYLYSLERVGRILDTEFIGEHEWYPLGARWLIDQQQDDGNWKGKGDEQKPELATSFSLLFLTRATQSLEVVRKRGGQGTLRTDVAAAPGHRVYIILDSSGTMMEEVDGVQRHKISRDAMADLVAEMPETNELALRAFGHRKAATQQGANEDTELLVPLGKLDRKKVVAALTNLRARGKTPLSRTLMEVAQDVRSSARAERPTTVVLVTDGGEDNTKPAKTPVEAAKELANLPGVSLYVVGFDIDRPEWVEQLQALAAAGGGQYLAANDPQSLLPGLRSAVYRTPESFVVQDAKGRPIRKAKFKQAVKLPEGKYAIQTDYGGKRYTEELWINTDSTTAVVFDASKIGVDESGGEITDADPKPAPARPAARRPAARKPAAADDPAPAPAAKKRFCTNCGAALNATAKFCPKCGTKAGG
ncbi:MAG TPA: VWA domain-containing protein [Tepidisphaeraceae bacterium]|nr:VWA domain-containing protein [Tepidisphaeraceae bacterium]